MKRYEQNAKTAYCINALNKADQNWLNQAKAEQNILLCTHDWFIKLKAPTDIWG